MGESSRLAIQGLKTRRKMPDAQPRKRKVAIIVEATAGGVREQDVFPRESDGCVAVPAEGRETAQG